MHDFYTRGEYHFYLMKCVSILSITKIFDFEAKKLSNVHEQFEFCYNALTFIKHFHLCVMGGASLSQIFNFEVKT